jgi:16S rRNA (guanine527-N7)-methyltransferase
MEILLKYFPQLDETQQNCFAALEELYRFWNEKINLISRKDIEHLYEHHVLHSLAIAKVYSFKEGAQILDLGTGGGFPGVPLAILFPQVNFFLIDGTAKKIKVVEDVIQKLGLRNAKAMQVRAEALKKMQFDFVVTRAVADLVQLKPWCQRLLKTKHLHGTPNGIIALKGGNVKAEIKALGKGEYAEVYPIPAYFEEPYFQEKYVVYLQG